MIEVLSKEIIHITEWKKTTTEIKILFFGRKKQTNNFFIVIKSKILKLNNY